MLHIFLVKMTKFAIKMHHHIDRHQYHRKSISQYCRFVATIFTLIGLLHGVRCEIEEISKLRGHTATLECPIDVKSCGNLHSLKWFKGDDRVALVMASGSSVEGPYSGRITIDHSPTVPHSKLFIKSVQVHDEEIYTCLIIYLRPSDSCNSSGSHKIKLNVLVTPSTMQILDEAEQPLPNGTVIGPLSEGQRLTSYCEARGGRPAPIVTWYSNGEKLHTTNESSETNGLYTVRSKLSIGLARKELGATFRCLISSPSLGNVPIQHQLKLDLQVRPKRVEVSGFRQHTVQGSTVQLLCKVSGARPAANITWYNNTTPLTNNSRITIHQKLEDETDLTTTMLSQLTFTASRFENSVTIRCDADNIVMQQEQEKPLHSSVLLQVMYPPVVTVAPAHNLIITENSDIYLDCRYDSNPSSLKRVIWKRNGDTIDVKNSRMEGGDVDSIGLKIKKVLRTDLGNYTCELQNDFGFGASDNSISLDVHYTPVVELVMEPNTHIIESEAVNVTLMCRILSGNPPILSRVTWFLDGGILKELPECNENGDDTLCGVDPDILLLENVGRHFLGNYSCEGQNSAGWGNRSGDKELLVYYEPGKAKLLHYPLVASKKKTITLFCSVEDGGYPNATQYVWTRGGYILQYDTAMITFENIGLDSRTNFSCYAYNKGGKGQSDTIELDVLAKPAFIQNLQPRTAALYSAKNISLSCRVECVPLCTITWYKNGVGIEKSDIHYTITESFLPADKAIGDFESVLSTLHFNISSWPDQQLDIHQDDANYSCVSSANSEGPGVRGLTDFHVEYPPENTTISDGVIDVEEGFSPPRVSCSGNAYPPLQYQWIRNNKVKCDGPILHIYEPLKREDDGIYECISKNKHGNQTAQMRINILFKPNCTISQKIMNDEPNLVCEAFGNPKEMTFKWLIKSGNETEILEDWAPGTGSGTSRTLPLNNEKNVEYRCIANNSVGIGTECEIKINGQEPWWKQIGLMNIIIASVTALLLLVIIICCIIICVCRKRRQKDKSRGKSSLGTDLLSDHGEYENLPFHGLQTAPNKCVTPSQTSTSATTPTPTYCYNLAHSFPSTNSNNRNATIVTNVSTYPNFHHINNADIGTNDSSTTATNALYTATNLKQYQQPSHHQLAHHKQYQTIGINSMTIDSNTTKMPLNPFLAKRPKSLSQMKRERNLMPAPPPLPITHRSTINGTNNVDNNTKFNSLKTINARKTPQFYSLRLNKCKRHQSLANATYGGTQQKLLVINTNAALPYLQQQHHSNKLNHTETGTLEKINRFSQQQQQHQHQQPLYENLVNSSLEQNDNVIPNMMTTFDEYSRDLNDANSIYRSDSGISNSSYELTPVPAPRNNPRNCQSAPVYMNLPKYASICGTSSKYRNDCAAVLANKSLGYATTAFNYERFMPTNPFSTSNNRRQQILVPKELFPRGKSGAENKLTLSSSFRRPVKLPLRKHHSFHFQSSQTVAGALKHEQFQQKEQNASAKERYKNHGPLVFMPFSEKSAFKPIVPTKTSPNDLNDEHDGEQSERNDFDTIPRICGSSLKRHISNVETFSSNHWRTNMATINNDDDTNLQAHLSKSGRRKIHYADLAPLSSTSNTTNNSNDRNNNNNNNNNSHCQANDNPTKVNARNSKSINDSQSSNAKQTQYATLRFDEVSI